MKAESVIQRAVRQRLAIRGYEAVAVPNGSHLAGDKIARIKQIAAMKADGLKPGFPDLIVIGRGRVGFMEIKTPKGVMSQAQRNCRAWLEKDGQKFAVVYDAGEVDQVLLQWGWP